MARIIPLNSTGAVDKAGRDLVADDSTPEQIAYALSVVNNWRAAHSFPLNTLTVLLKQKAPVIDPDVAVVQRIKRLPSILYKLKRFDGYRLSQIQDIGGCRAVVSDVSDVYKLVESFDRSRMRHELAKSDDYIQSPQDSGYRGIHLIYKYKSDRNPAYNGRKIEIQLRSVFQHAWATAVETVGAFTGEALKSSAGNADWLRFFRLMGSVIANQEKAPAVPNTPANFTELLDELRSISSALDVTTRLRGYRDVLMYMQEPFGAFAGIKYYLLRLETVENKITVEGFVSDKLDDAISAYTDAEKNASSSLDVVLVSADSIAALQKAYPNYFADTRIFLGLLEDALAGNPLEAEDAQTIDPVDANEAERIMGLNINYR